jgi:imidazole glycerol-phosphate synthase subunit HisH
MKRSVTIVDYGCGNLFSVLRALDHCGGDPALADSAAAVESADRLVLPGVGAFGDGMKGLRERGVAEAVQRFADSGRPLLGICLGMQFGKHEGLGLIPGHVVPVPYVDVESRRQKIPHIGWNELVQPAPARWVGTIFHGMPEQTAVYLVHSFHLVPAQADSRLANCLYGGHELAAAVQVGNTIGFQFHPEKSGPAGLKMLAQFLRL